MTDTEMALVVGAVSLLVIGLSVPLVLRRIAPNLWYGFRTASTLKDETLWYEVNAKTGVDLLVVGIGLALVTVAHVLDLLPAPAFSVVASALLLGGALVSTVHGFLLISRSRK